MERSKSGRSRAAARRRGLNAGNASLIIERGRADRFAYQKHRTEYIVGHGIQRSLLSCDTRVEPDRLRFGIGPAGKPFIANFGSDIALNPTGTFILAIVW